MSEKIDERTAYLAMFEFLRQRYKRTGEPDEIGILLGELSLLEDGGSADPAAMQDWREAVEVVQEAEGSPEGYQGARLELGGD
jgi:hypothetical protein